MTALGETPSQTLGPFFHQGLVRVRRMFQLPELCPDFDDVIGNVLTGHGMPGQRVRIVGSVYDGQSKPVPDALIEIWQADSFGRYHAGQAEPQSGELSASGAVWGFGRASTDEAGGFFFDTIKPGVVQGASARQAPHINVIVGARGMSRLAFTRVYFSGDPELDRDPVLARVPPERRHTLIAEAERGATNVATHRFEIRLQGDDETVFFEL